MDWVCGGFYMAWSLWGFSAEYISGSIFPHGAGLHSDIVYANRHTAFQ